MAIGTFTVDKVSLPSILNDIAAGIVQLPDFQRGWVWPTYKIVSFIISVTRGFPTGTILLLETGVTIQFKPRLVEGLAWPDQRGPSEPHARSLVLDGQQRLTSLFQALMLDYCTVIDKKQPRKVFIYVDIPMLLGLDPEYRGAAGINRAVRAYSEKKHASELATREQQYEKLMFPVSQTLTYDDWFGGFQAYWQRQGRKGMQDYSKLLPAFRDAFNDVFKSYLVLTTGVRNTTSPEAVCAVFDRVNEGGVKLTTFDLLAASFAVDIAPTDTFNLRDDWATRSKRMSTHAVLRAVKDTSFLQIICLLKTKAAASTGDGSIDCSIHTMMALRLADYQRWADAAEAGLIFAARFLKRLMVVKKEDIPYQSQLVPLAAILYGLGDLRADEAVIAKLQSWFWCGVFGEMYAGSQVTRFARDMREVFAWIDGSAEPATIRECHLDFGRLFSLQRTSSAAVKGIHALIRQNGGVDWLDGPKPSNEEVHHIFAKTWCRRRGHDSTIFDSVLNKTPLARTTIALLKDSPSAYLAQLDASVGTDVIDHRLKAHFIDPALLRADDFEGMLRARATKLQEHIQLATNRLDDPDRGGPFIDPDRDDIGEEDEDEDVF